MGPRRAGSRLSGVRHALGFNYIALSLGPGYKDRPSGAAWGRFGPVRAEWGRVGPSGAEWGGWGWVGLGRGWACIGMQLNNSGPSKAEWGRVELYLPT